MRAILQVADTGPLESLVVMLRSVGVECFTPGEDIKRALRALSCDTVLDIRQLVEGMGYDKPMPLPEAKLPMMAEKDVLYIDVKAHRNGPRIWSAWPNLKDRTLWYRINGGKPEHVVNDRGDHGNEVNPPCPVLTPNQWYRHDCKVLPPCNSRIDYRCQDCLQKDMAYTCWPPFYRFEEYYPKHGRSIISSPMCLIHGINGWGYGALIPNMRKLGVRFYGTNAPDGLINHRNVASMLSRASCMVHLKSNDAPGYALYEALAAGCPVVCTRRLIWRSHMEQLFIPDVTCLVFDKPTHDALSPEDVVECTNEVAKAIVTLSDPAINRRIGLAGRERLREIMWSETNPDDVRSLRQFMERNFK